MNVTLYGLPHCSTCKKALARLAHLGVTVDRFVDIKTAPLSAAEIAALAEAVGGAQKLFSKRARRYRAEGLHQVELSDADRLRWMETDYTFLTRPVVIWEGGGMCGYREARYDQVFGA